MNVYDSQKIADILAASHGMITTEDPQNADVLLLNTCAIRDKAEEKVFSDLGRFRAFKKKRPEIIIGVGGCIASHSGEKILKRAPYVDFVFGPQTIHQLPILYDEVIEKKSHPMDIRLLENEKFTYFPPPRACGASAFVTIMEGCDRFCSYCIVPQTRGREISRPFAEIIRECQQLAEQGVKEIHLLGQNVNAYCDKDSTEKTQDLADLLIAAARIENIARLRFTTSHPAVFSEHLLEVFATEPKVVNHLHLPVQSGCNRILNLMRRGYTVEEYKEKIQKLRAIRPEISVSSDFIVGFPGETEADFLETLDFVKEMHFDHSFSFIYSPRPNTSAATLTDDVPLAKKKQRLLVLQNLLNSEEKIISQTMLNSVQEILVTDVARKNTKQLMGRTENNRIVNFHGDPNLIGKTVPVKITEILRNSMRGEI
ncbi:MAG: tRNA (N6-isopentenyl adenosine(37)-C2)-methylthiotransferase MiaB [Gammaproteobacteria bacterium GWE2_37_16]|nr:MAG: tRNA (N6-isopentenyl adenosine(37)-C2)-methylthiotransferase MiaB [Gammaproteobacteria bacterium GWE2_37_16]